MGRGPLIPIKAPGRCRCHGWVLLRGLNPFSGLKGGWVVSFYGWMVGNYFCFPYRGGSGVVTGRLFLGEKDVPVEKPL